MEKILQKYYRFFFLGVTGLLLYPTLGRGYIFLLDWTVEPNLAWIDIHPRIDSIGWMLYKLGAIIFSFGVFQRIFLFVTIYFLGLAGFRLAKRTGNVFAQAFAGLFLIFNPFIYARLMEQTGIALGSAFFFWFLVYLLEYLQERKGRKIWLASVWAALAVSLFAHSIFFVATTILFLLICDFGKKRNWQFSLRTVAIIFGVIILLNANWLFSFARGSDQGVGGLRSFDSADLDAFRTREIRGDSIYSTVLSLQGYWGESQDRFVSIRENPLWEVAFWAILLLAIFGLFERLKKKDYLAGSLLVSAIIAYVLAIGVASPISAPLANWLYAHFPLYIGLRESQKWVVVLVFVYAYFGAWGITYFLKWDKIKNYRYEWSFMGVLLPVIFAFPMIRGLHEHLTPHEFPVEWQQAKQYLTSQPTTGRILFFPWHLYANLDFAGKNVVVPAPGFFGSKIIQGNNTEFGKVYSHSLDQQTLTIEKYVVKKDNPMENIDYTTFATDMRSLGIQTVMLARTEDWSKYFWLDRVNGVEKVLENDKLTIYQLP